MAYFPRKYLDSGADKWDETVTNKSFPHYFYYYEADLYLNAVLENSRLSLELGAGTCGSTVNHASPERRLVAIDYSPRMLKLGREASECRACTLCRLGGGGSMSSSLSRQLV